MSRLQRNVLFGLIAFLVIPAIILLDRKGGQNLRKGPLCRDPHARDVNKYHGKIFKVINIVDGDTIDIDVPDGAYEKTRIRLLGIDTPETARSPQGAMYYGKEASEFAEKLCLDKEVTVLIDTVSRARDKYGRLLAYLVLADGTVVNELLVKEGFAYADLRFAHSRYQKYAQMQDVAVREKRGLWENVKQEDLPTWLLRELPDLQLTAEK